VTYEQLSAYWGPTSGEPYIDRINAMPKYVASRSLTQTAWNATRRGREGGPLADRRGARGRAVAIRAAI
jgi:hypothetical protein